MSQKRILLISNTTQSFWIYRRDLIQHLISSGYDIHCAAPPDSAAAQIQSLGATVYPIPLSRSGINPISEIRSIIALSSLLRHVRPDIIFGYTIKPNTYIPFIAQIFSIPCVSIVTGLGYSFISTSLKALISRYIFIYGLSFSKQIWTYNPQDLKDIVFYKKNMAPKISLIPGSGINITEFNTNNLKLNTAPPLSFIMISRLLIDKGIREYIAAAALVQQQYPGTQFHILGPLDHGNPASLTQSELDQAIQSGTIHYHPPTQDVRPFLAQTDCIVLPSYREGIPKVLLEAGAMGKPSITTDVPGCRDIIQNDKNGFIVPAGQTNALSQAMINFILMSPNKRAEMGETARNHIIQYFSNDIVFKKYDTYLANIFQPHGSKK